MAATKTIPAIRVTSRSPKGAIWRAGRYWTPQPTTVARSEFSEGEIAALAAEPLLLVEPAQLDANGEAVAA